ncbi:MAG: ribosome small subunit-dependent GTPase A [Candidatus Kapabacteria bacterium]|nr:ribosome small subunit-dependent GTPase A [Candidatus Kapabacteria bacterium]
MASKKHNPKQDTLSKSRRTAKSWTKASSEKQFYEKKTHWNNDDEAVPDRAVSMSPRLKNIQHKITIPTQNTFEGWVIDSTGRSFIVERLSGEGEHGSHLYDCVVSRSIVSENPASTLVAVGDRVICRIEPVSGEVPMLPGVIVVVKERKTKLARESAGRDGMEQVIVSNVDQVVILMSAADPFYNRRLIDRYLVAIELGDVEPIICINKMDLMDETFVREDVAMYAEHLGITTLFVSAEKRKGLEALHAVLQGKITVFSGPSGVGKSTLVNLLLGEEAQITTEVSSKTQKGLHTTTFSKVFRLPHGGYVLDTPGIREFGIWGLDKEDLAYYFHDFDEDRLQCKFAPCTHTHEPGCAVKAALEEGAIDPERYASYLNILETLP